MKTNGLDVLDAPEVDVVSAADRFAKLTVIYLRWQAIEDEYGKLKGIFRDVARGRTMDFPTSDNSAYVRVEQKPDRVCRKVPRDMVAPVVRLCGEALFDLMTIHPSAGEYGSFQVNAFKLLTKAKATALYEKLLEHATAFVKLFKREEE
jgi:hypothetical protein